MAALPYMPLYWSDFLSDTTYLDNFELGIYVRLLGQYWQTGKPLPNDDQKLAKICKISLKKFQKNKKTVIEFFQVSENFLTHSRLEKELAKANEKSIKSRLAGQISGEKRKSNKATDVQQTLNECSTDDERTLNHTDNNITDNNIVDVVVIAREENFNHSENSGAGTSPDSERLAAWKQYWSNKGFKCKWITDANINRLCLLLVTEQLTEQEVNNIITETNEVSKPQNVSSPCYYEKPIREYIEAKKNPKPIASGQQIRGNHYASTKNARQQELERVKQERAERNAEVFRRKREREAAERR